MPSSTVTRGNALSTFYIQPTLSPAAVASYTSAVQTFTVPGLQTTDFIQAVGAIAAQTAGIITAECDCYTANILSVQFVNATVASATPVSGAYVFQVTRSDGPLPATAV
jgi:hypothetical protein